MARPSGFSPEVRERAVRMVFEHAQDHLSQWAAITSIAEKIGCAAETLRHWARRLDERIDEATRLAGPERVRVWRLYLRAARRGFESGFTSVYQVRARV